MPQCQRRFLRTLSLYRFSCKRLRCIYCPSTCIYVLQHVRKILYATDPTFFSSCFVSSVTAVSVVLIISSLATYFQGYFFSPSYCCIYMQFSRHGPFIRAAPLQQTLSSHHSTSSTVTNPRTHFCADLTTTRRHHSLSEKDL